MKVDENYVEKRPFFTLLGPFFFAVHTKNNLATHKRDSFKICNAPLNMYFCDLNGLKLPLTNDETKQDAYPTLSAYLSGTEMGFITLSDLSYLSHLSF